MIDGFEIETAKLSEEDERTAMLMVPHLANKLGRDNAVTSDKMIAGMKRIYNIDLNGARVRKIINYIRRTGLVKGLIASSKGYYVAENKDEFKRYIEKSIKQRAYAILAVAEELEKQMQ